MAVKKIAISLPEDVLRQVDRLAKKTKTTRSGCIARVLAAVSHVTTQGEITAEINRIFEDPHAAQEQADTTNVFLRAAEETFGDSEW